MILFLAAVTLVHMNALLMRQREITWLEWQERMVVVSFEVFMVLLFSSCWGLSDAVTKVLGLR